MARWRSALFLTIACSAGGAVQAQPTPTIDQISNVLPSAEMPLNPTDTHEAIVPPAQLTSGKEASPAQPQITSERRDAPPPEQLSKGPRTAQAPQSLSQRAEGRPTGVEKIAGDDRCDPAERHLPKARCASVIENRSSEFARPDPTELSPEQRLLLEQEVREGALDPVSGARQLATTGEADESLAAMGVAAAVMRSKDEPHEDRKPDEDVAKAAEIIGAIINQPVAPPPQ